MKILSKMGLLILFAYSCSILAYQPREYLFIKVDNSFAQQVVTSVDSGIKRGSLVGGVSGDESQKLTYEKRKNDNSESNVVIIDGFNQFQQIVINGSVQKPVVVKLFSSENVDSKKVAPVFQGVADTLGHSVLFVAINILADSGEGASENNQLVFQVMVHYGLKRLDLPAFLFFKGAMLVPPTKQGFDTEENLVAFVKNKLLW
jgi:thiol-disulfide isomerase/thioredoxin